jgi:predicted outer membrane repeat protein
LILECSVYEASKCNTTISNTIFENNNAGVKGGAISYNFKPPLFTNESFINNTAPYGNDKASYPIMLRILKNPNYYESSVPIQSNTLIVGLLDADE